MALPTRPYVTTRTHGIFATAHDLADRLGHDEVTPVHLTIALLQEGMNPAAQLLLYSCQLRSDPFQQELMAALPTAGSPRPSTADHSWSASDERMLELAAVEAKELGKEYVGCEHLLLAFLRDPTTEPAMLLARHGVKYDRIRLDVQSIYNRTMVWAGPAD